MKKKKTSSPSTFIMDDINKKTVRKYKRKNKTYYPVSVPEHVMLKFLDRTRVKHPKVIKKRFRYFEEEYIDGKKVSKDLDNSVLIGVLTSIIYELRTIYPGYLKKYIKWNNNTEFLRFQLSSFREYIKKYKFKDKLAKMGLDEELIGVFRKIHMDDNRKMYLIHGDFQKSNLLEHAGMYYIVDWEHATYGDLAYEIAMHLSKENYSEEEIKLLIDRLCGSLSIDPENFLRDIKLYKNFEKIRVSFDKMNKACELQKAKKDFRHALDEAYESYKFLAIAKSKEEIKQIIISK